MYAFILNTCFIPIATNNIEIIMKLITISVILKNILGGCQKQEDDF